MLRNCQTHATNSLRPSRSQVAPCVGPRQLDCRFWPKRLAARSRNLSVCLLLTVFCVEASARHDCRAIASTPGVHALQRYALSWRGGSVPSASS